MATTIFGQAVPIAKSAVSPHRKRVIAATVLAVAIVLGLIVYGFDYYWLSAAERPFSEKHALLKPSGMIGIKLGMLGLGMFCTIFLYALRKRIGWLSKLGSSRHWLDFHILLGITGPVVIAFHASFKFQGIAGMAFWIMVAVALSGIVGRYIYAQIPRTLNSAELSLRELEAMEKSLSAELAGQRLFSRDDLESLSRMPSGDEVRAMPVYRAFLGMVLLDVARPFRVARLRRKAMSGAAILFTFGGLLRTGNSELEHIVRTGRRRSMLSKRVVFLARTQQVFHLWHVVHRPFSYSFAVLAILHIAVVISLGYL